MAVGGAMKNCSHIGNSQVGGRRVHSLDSRRRRGCHLVGAGLLALVVMVVGCDLCGGALVGEGGYFKDRPAPVYEFIPPIE